MKKITMTALVKAVKTNCIFMQAKIVERTTNKLTLLYGNDCSVTFEIFGDKSQYIGFNVYGYLNYVRCEELINIMKSLEERNIW